MKSITIKPSTPIPADVTRTVKTLRQSGHRALLAGGCVRDMILGRTPRDWDIVTDAPLDEIRKLFPDHLEVGVAFGIVKLKNASVGIDIAIFRKESEYSDRRHPDKVEVGDEATDTARRDFTVNALYFDPEKSEVIDYVDGYKDIGAKILRTVGDPTERFSEDALRILRAARFSAQLGFKIETQTTAAMKKCASLLEDISRERIREETYRLLESGKPIFGLEIMVKTALWEQVFGVKKLQIPADFRSLKFVEKPTAFSWICALGVTGLLGDPLKSSEKIADNLVELLKLTNDEKRIFSKIIRIFNDAKKPTGSPLDWIDLAKKEKNSLDMAKRFIRRARGITIEDKDEAIKLIEQAQRWAMKPNPDKHITSAQILIKEGFKEGPKLGAELKSRQWDEFWTLKN